MQPSRLGLAKRPQRQPQKGKLRARPDAKGSSSQDTGTWQRRKNKAVTAGNEGKMACQCLRWRLACLFQRLPPRTRNLCAGGRGGVAAVGLLGARRSRAGAWVEAPSACHGGGLAEVAGAGDEPQAWEQARAGQRQPGVIRLPPGCRPAAEARSHAPQRLSLAHHPE